MANEHAMEVLNDDIPETSQENYFLEILDSYKISIVVYTVILAFMISLYYSELNYETPNATKKLTVQPKPYYYPHPRNDMYELQRAVSALQEQLEFLANNIQILQDLLDSLRSTMTENGGYVNAKQVKALVNTALEVYDVDKTGMPDYALLSTGAYILGTPSTIAASKWYKLFGFKVYAVYSQPTELLQPDVTPGRCFRFEGTKARVQIRLSQKILVKAVTMEHAHKSIVGNKIPTAPKTFIVYGLYEELNTIYVQLGVFDYSIDGPARQTFIIPQEKQSRVFDSVELRILSNQGRVEVTCVYRFRVHGEPVYD